VKGDLIAVTLTASKDLNTFNNQSHTLVLVLYQLTQSSVYAQFLDTPEGKSKLLAGESFDPSVLSRRRVVLQPGETQRIELDRMEGARYLAAVAGYYNVQTQDMSRVLPVVRETSGLPGFKKLKPQLVHLSLGKSGFAQ
jgi:type VI secretion system VasD/TssJ family lipoprotein